MRCSAAARCWQAVTTFFGDVLEHPVVEEEFRDQELQAFDLDRQRADTACVIDLGGVVQLPPAVVGVVGNAVLAADVGDREPLGQVAIRLSK